MANDNYRRLMALAQQLQGIGNQVNQVIANATTAQEEAADERHANGALGREDRDREDRGAAAAARRGSNAGRNRRQEAQDDRDVINDTDDEEGGGTSRGRRRAPLVSPPQMSPTEVWAGDSDEEDDPEWLYDERLPRGVTMTPRQRTLRVAHQNRVRGQRLRDRRRRELDDGEFRYRLAMQEVAMYLDPNRSYPCTLSPTCKGTFRWRSNLVLHWTHQHRMTPEACAQTLSTYTGAKSSPDAAFF